ncbi:MAG: LysR family transcriptional regulator [Bradymonadaceae bacterium]|nr:LysR family transcriptional regulator [Lujinxingiaceae bacterium]
MDSASAMAIFVEVVREQGFTAAARKLQLSKSHVSKQIDRLEERLGVRLLQRTTRNVTVTELGAVYFERCLMILADISEAERALSQQQLAPKGVLRVTAPMTFGLHYLNPAVCDFMRRYPDLDVDIQFSDPRVDIVEQGFDVAVRVGALSDSSLFARHLAPVALGLVASPEYLERFGRPAHPRDLKDHSCLLYSYQAMGASWRFNGPDGETLVRVEGRMVANNGQALVEAARQGLGIVLSPDFIAVDAIRAGELEFILTPWTTERLDVWAVYPHRRYLSQKVRLFIDFLVERFAGAPPWACLDDE